MSDTNATQAGAGSGATPAGVASGKLALIGFMGSGKSSAARRLGPGVVDVDATIEAREGRSISEIFASGGEAAFRAIEERVTLELLADPTVGVLALGGGALGSERVRAALDGGVRTVWLDVEADAAWRHAQTQPDVRPLARDRGEFERLFAERRPVYERTADVIVPAQRADDLDAVLAACEGLPVKGGKVIWAATAAGGYPVYIREGLLDFTQAPGSEPDPNADPDEVEAARRRAARAFWPATISGRRMLVTDHNVGRYYADVFNPTCAGIGISPGERAKTLASAELIWNEMAASGVTRADVVVAVGGGVVGDLAGFCAAAYQRGMAVVQVPTTVVSQADSAYGGKTGVDLPEAKNYVGAFHQPSAVIVDPRTLQSLPAVEVAAGYAEVVKTALIAGGELWELIRGGAPATDPRVITGSALTKLRVVAGDERDLGRRQSLNLGHTVAHALEVTTGYARYRHGEAVALGLLAALRLSGADELRAEVKELLVRGGLSVRVDGEIDLDQVIRATARDKKRLVEGPVPFVLCPEPGDVRIGQAVAPADLQAAVKELQA
jgi:shikimate kinase/3-dehydroquinate synthase